ncbi:ketoacyl-ACP synthase III [Streptomyces durbertensis]|uniref:Beta-ketoacyl-[acyl-carrier-protein] synthase III n=1 Tax=Streptomyces durbertensis TaxID=2448886 RepID=A0ABR6EGL2_9ACTN|nr:beta-ketoacyl-ACP synthase 3 [Streptomyces durbertensis]MBB1244474.1 ketoacyl-ACP synthase III [Streptomyces durbertensis]
MTAARRPAAPARPPAPAAVLCGVGGWVPPREVTNAELSRRLDTSDEWIRSRTGIRERRMINPGDATSDLAVEAGRLALKSSGEGDADAVVLATTTPDRPCPGTAPEVAHRLGLTGAAAFDVSAVCTGFLYALAAGQGLIAAGTARRVLVVAADAFTTIIDPADRGTAVIFADGAGAVVLRAGEPDEPGALGRVVLGSDGEQAELIQVPAGGSRQRSTGRPAPERDHYFQMRGRETFRQAVGHMSAASRAAVADAGWRLADVDRVVAHQANARILAAVADELELAEDRLLSNIAHVGNTGGASIPLLLAQAQEGLPSVSGGRLAAGDRLLLTAFGAGLAWGATALVWPDLPG